MYIHIFEKLNCGHITNVIFHPVYIFSYQNIFIVINSLQWHETFPFLRLLSVLAFDVLQLI